MCYEYTVLGYIWLLPIAVCLGAAIFAVILKIAVLVCGKRNRSHQSLVPVA
jgi:hypothetical protein